MFRKWIETNIFIAMQNAAKAVTEDKFKHNKKAVLKLKKAILL
jgi:hypothetical protein